ncbi:hypothetical protein RCL1_008987 [Eukaryota sp. TZLM3-RCL]
MTHKFIDVLKSKFGTSRDSNFECNVVLKVQSEEVALHGDVLAVYCEFQEGEDIPHMIDLSEVSGISVELVEDFVNFFYGKPLTIKKENSSSALQLAQRLGCSVLLEFCKEIDESRGENDTDRLVPDIMTLILQLQAKGLSMHTIIYRNLEFRISRFLLNLFFNFFHKKWSLPCPDSEDDFTDFTDKFHFSTAEFSNFWTSFFSSFGDDVEHLYVCVHLASYFGFSDLQIYLQELYSQQSPSKCFERDLILANDHDDLVFIEFLTIFVNKFPEFTIGKFLLLSSEVYIYLASHLEHDFMINWLVESVVYSYIILHSISTENVSRILSVVKVNKTQVVKLYESLKPLLSCKCLVDEVSNMLSSTLLPLLTKQYTELKSNHDILMERSKQQEQELHRQKIVSAYEKNNKKIVYHNVEASHYLKGKNCLELPNYSGLLFSSTIGPRNVVSADISHPIDGRVSLTFNSPGQGTQLGFYCDKTKVTTGVEFLKKIGSSQQVRVCNEVHEIPTTNCLVVVAFHFSTTMDVCFQIPALGVYSTTEVPCGSVLRVRLLGGGSKCTLS